jgi:hypothetical protein
LDVQGEGVGGVAMAQAVPRFPANYVFNEIKDIKYLTNYYSLLIIQDTNHQKICKK